MTSLRRARRQVLGALGLEYAWRLSSTSSAGAGFSAATGVSAASGCGYGWRSSLASSAEVGLGAVTTAVLDGPRLRVQVAVEPDLQRGGGAWRGEGVAVLQLMGDQPENWPCRTAKTGHVKYTVCWKERLHHFFEWALYKCTPAATILDGRNTSP